jgi:hypothetical protein
LVILEPMLVAAQPLFKPQGGLIGTGISIRRKCVGFEHNAGIEMNHAVGAETETLLADGDVAGKSTVEILRRHLRDARIDARAQRLPDVDILARDAKRHDRPPMTSGRQS